MQTVTDAQAALLTANRVEVSAGLEVLDLDLNVTDDISDDLVGGSVAWNGDARIHRTCRLAVSAELAWGSSLLRPYMSLTDGSVSFTARTGAFYITTPEYPLGETPVTYSCQGYDRVHLADRKVGDDYSVTANGSYTYGEALEQAFSDAGLTGYLIDGVAYDYVVPATKSWPLVARSTDPDETSTPVTWLRVIGDLLQAINFRGLYADENGTLRCQQYQEPSVRAPEFTFDADEASVTIVGEQRTVVADAFKQPTRWVFIRTNGGTGVAGDGLYEVSGTATELAARGGLDWPEVFEYEAASQAVLESLGNRRVAHDRRLVTHISATTGPFPVAGHADVFTYIDQAAGGSMKVIAREWEMDLLGGDVRWSWERIT